MLGPLAIKFSTTLITGKKTANGAANPELARAGGGVRWAILEEPDGDEEINIGYLKSLSGNDSYFARDLFEKGKQTKEMTPMFKLTFICNKLPALRHSDKATWNRIRVIPFESTFVRPGEPCPESYEEQLKEKRFPMDTEFSKKIPSLLEPFAWILLEHRKNMKVRVEPEKVRIATETYRKQNDSYRQFVDECIMNAPNSYLSLIEIYQQFKDWFKEGFPGQSLPVKNQVKEYFTKLWGEPDNLKWKGYKIKTIDDEIQTGVALVLDDGDLVDYETISKNTTPDF
jgi:phage/plasmid-associated DNA primase